MCVDKLKQHRPESRYGIATIIRQIECLRIHLLMTLLSTLPASEECPRQAY